MLHEEMGGGWRGREASKTAKEQSGAQGVASNHTSSTPSTPASVESSTRISYVALQSDPHANALDMAATIASVTWVYHCSADMVSSFLSLKIRSGQEDRARASAPRARAVGGARARQAKPGWVCGHVCARDAPTTVVTRVWTLVPSSPARLRPQKHPKACGRGWRI